MEINSKYPNSVPADVHPVTPADYWTNTRRLIHAWLNEQASPLAELYEGAVQLIFEKSISGKLRFVAHAVREIRNRLPDYISGGKTGERLEYKKELDQLLKIWQDSGFSLDSGIGDQASLPLSAEISIPLHLFHSIQQLFIKHNAVTTNNKEKAIQFFETSIPQNELRNTLRPIAEHWWDVTEWFMGKTHDSGRVSPGDDEQRLQQQFELFESFLGTLTQSFYTTTDELDEILKESSPSQINKAVTLLIHPQQRNYFFNRLESAHWIVPLREKGFFKNPPHVVHNSSEGTVSFPIWPASRYLTRMAAQEASAILEIGLQIETDNPNVHEDFVEAALQMPSALAVKIVPKVKTWVKSRYLSYTFSDEVAALAVHLAKGGKVKEALDLARSLLTVEQDPRMNNEESSKNEIHRFSPRPQSRFDNWQYEQVLTNYVPELVAVASEDALKMLGNILCCAVKFSRHPEENIEQDENLSIRKDHSCIWRPAIEEHHRNHHPDEIRELLVVAVRDAAEQIVKKDPAKMRSLVLMLEKWRWRIFHRIALYLLRKFPDANRDLLFERLADRKHFNDTIKYDDYEYALLAKEYFAELPKQKQEEIFNWIENPDIDYSWLMEREKEALGAKRWQLKKLTLLKGSLPAKWQQRYEQLVKEFGAVELSNMVFGEVGKSSISGIRSPKTDSELEFISIEDLVSFLRTWQPRSDARFDDPSLEGLGNVLVRVVEKSPERYALAAKRFQGLHPMYINSLLWGLDKALNTQKEQQAELQAFPWSSVLCLCQWTVEESNQIQERQTNNSAHQNLYWDSACHKVTYLLKVGLTMTGSGIPFNLREEVWSALKLLTQYSEPPEKMQYSGSTTNFTQSSTRTVRNEAMHRVVCYALWIRRHFEQMADGSELIARGFDEMPEVRQVLDAHLDLNQEQSLATRSVYGQRFPWLLVLDLSWVTQSIGKIFPQDETLSDLRRAAWESYITYCPLYDNLFDVLHQEYSYAVERLNVAPSEESLTDAHQRLADHLMTLYWWGKLDLDEPGGLLKRFFELASDMLRTYALKFIGRNLRETKDEVDLRILNRLQLLWEQRIDVVRTATSPTLHTIELTAFGWWFASRKFDNSWAIEQLKQVYELVDKVDADSLIVEHLAALAGVIPTSAVECLSLMIEKDKTGQSIYGWRNKQIRPILAAAIKSSDGTARKTAEALINYLGELGFLEFRELLPKESNSEL